MLKDEYKGKKVFISGITGFKGSWMAILLNKLGANVSGLGLPQEEKETIFYQGDVRSIAKVFYQNLRDEFPTSLKNEISTSDYVFHFAAQPIVSEGYRDPYGTLDTNVMGTVKMLELVKNTDHPLSFLSVASDRVYASVDHAHVETDQLVGYEPYSISKVFDNMLVDMYAQMDGVSPLLRLVNARASNVIGGGDKGLNRIVTSITDAAHKGEVLKLRNPAFVRPYLYVLDCLSQYLYIAAYGEEKAYNIGTDDNKTSVSVDALVKSFTKLGYPGLTYNDSGEKFGFEGNVLMVNADLFHNEFPNSKSIAQNIDDVVMRILKVNESKDYKADINDLINEAILNLN